MVSLASVLLVVHLVGLALGVGGATVKSVLLLRCRGDRTLIPLFLRISPIVTRQIIAGLVLLTLSGIGWLVLGYGFTTVLVVKLVLVGAIWVLGPVIDNVVEPPFVKLAPAEGADPSPEFVRARDRYVAFELIATGLFYVVIAVWVLG